MNSEVLVQFGFFKKYGSCLVLEEPVRIFPICNETNATGLQASSLVDTVSNAVSMHFETNGRHILPEYNGINGCV